MKIAVLSGKGGTGKTFVSVNLAYAIKNAVYIDCDVEEPNGRLFLKPKITNVEKVNVMIPNVITQKCTGCRICVDFCKFNALAYIKEKLLIFPELCHACKGCVMLCPEKALKEESKNIGYIEYGLAYGIEVKTGVLNVGEATGVPIIKKLFAGLPKDKITVIDCPPGSACTVMESIRDSDFCLMVAEPTRFGIHNLNMIYNLIKLFDKPHALIVNKDMGDNSLIEEYCYDKKINIFTSIPYDSKLGLVNSKGLIASQIDNRYLEIFKGMLSDIEREVYQ